MAGQIAPAEPFAIEDIRVEPVPQCLVCGTAGTARYEGLRDRLFSVPGRWSERVCPRDGHLWLDPRPVTADLGKLYTTYYTHADGTTPSLRLQVKQVVEAAGREAAFGYSSGRSGWAWFLVRSVVAHLPMVHDIAGSGVMWLHARHRGRLLDVGCGTGVIARTLHDLGWDVHGVEPDPEAAAIARRHLGSERVAIGTLDTVDLPTTSFDVIIAQQVIEHMPNPLAFLSQAHRLLRPGGRIVLTTPNTRSVCHRLFGRNWRELDPPRHLHLFSQRDLSMCARQAGLVVETSRTTARTAWEVWCSSRALRTHEGSLGATVPPGLRVTRRVQGYLFQLIEHALVSAGAEAGEVLVVVCRKP